jgi:hypothetical protein
MESHAVQENALTCGMPLRTLSFLFLISVSTIAQAQIPDSLLKALEPEPPADSVIQTVVINRVPAIATADYLTNFNKLNLGGITPGMTELMAAAYWGNDGKVGRLIDQNVVVDQRDYAGKTSLLHSLNQGHSSTSLLLMNAGASLRARDVRGETALHAIARSGLIEYVRPIIEAGVKPDAKDKFGMTPLMLACYYKNWEAAKLFMELSSNVNMQDNRGNTAMHWFIADKIPYDEGVTLDADVRLGLYQPEKPSTFKRLMRIFIPEFGIEDKRPAGTSLEDWILLFKVGGFGTNVKNNEGITPFDVAKLLNREDIIDRWNALEI